MEMEHTFRQRLRTKGYSEMLYLLWWLQNCGWKSKKNTSLFINNAINYLQRQAVWSLSHITYTASFPRRYVVLFQKQQ